MANVPAQPPSAGSALFQRQGSATPASRRWQIECMGDRWGAFQWQCGPVYWLRFFDTFAEAQEFVKMAIARAAVAK